MKQTAMLVVICLGVVSGGTAALAAEEPSGFRNVRFGATEEQIRMALPGVECYTHRRGSERLCRLNTEIGDIPAIVIFTLTPESGVARFRQAIISFNSHDYDVLRDAFIAKFGQPTGRILAANEQCRWWLSRSTASIQRYTSQLNVGVAALATREDFRSPVKRQGDERRERAKRGL
jgi:hypothetical protein